MKKNSLFQIIPAFGLLASSVVFLVNCKTKTASENTGKTVTNVLAIPALFERKGELAKAVEWEKTKQKVDELNQKIAQQPADVKSRLQIAVIYMSEARITGEHPYYYPAIAQILDGVLSLDGNNFEALVYKASVKLSQHQFAAAREVAEKASSINPDNAYVYGLLVDANVELGNYEEAVKMSEKMQDLKPSLESYSRVSYLREIYGDLPGAIEAMKLAVDAGLPGSEPFCWSKKTLAELYEKTGQWKEAANAYNEILAERPSYALAMEGLARVEREKKNYAAALDILQQAIAIMPEFSFHEEMGDIYELMGEKQQAKNKYMEVIGMLREDEQSGHTVSLEMCRIYDKAGMYDESLEYAKKEYAQRPLNIEVNQAMAWASYKKGDWEKAKEYIKVAHKTGSKDPQLQSRTAKINRGGQ